MEASSGPGGRSTCTEKRMLGGRWVGLDPGDQREGGRGQGDHSVGMAEGR